MSPPSASAPAALPATSARVNMDFLRDRSGRGADRPRSALLPFHLRVRAGLPVVLGDARLTLAAAADRYDLIILDAFSSDAIPVHLLTREALAGYLARLRKPAAGGDAHFQPPHGAWQRGRGRRRSRRARHLYEAGQPARYGADRLQDERHRRACAGLPTLAICQIGRAGTRSSRPRALPPGPTTIPTFSARSCARSWRCVNRRRLAIRQSAALALPAPPVPAASRAPRAPTRGAPARGRCRRSAARGGSAGRCARRRRNARARPACRAPRRRGPAMPVIDTARSTGAWASAPLAIASAVSRLTAPMTCERRRRDAEHRLLGRVAVGDEAALEDVGGAGDFSERGGQQPAGAGFRRRDLELLRAAKIEQRSRRARSVPDPPFSRSRAGGWWRWRRPPCLRRGR